MQCAGSGYNVLQAREGTEEQAAADAAGEARRTQHGHDEEDEGLEAGLAVAVAELYQEVCYRFMQ